jgi:hypothetical protein
LRRDEPVAHLADAFDVGGENVAGREPALRIAAQADSGGRAGEDEVTRQQREHPGQVLDEFRHAEDEILGAALLHLLAVDQAAELQVIPAGQLIRGDQPGPDRRETWVGLAQAELGRRGCQLQDPLRDILTGGHAGHMIPGRRGRHVIRGRTDDHHELHFPVGVPAWRECDVTVGAGHAGRELGEHGREDIGPREPGLRHVGTVIQPDAEHLPGRGRRRAEILRRIGLRLREYGGRCPVGELVPPLVGGDGIGAEPALTGGMDVNSPSPHDNAEALVDDGDAHGAPIQ